MTDAIYRHDPHAILDGMIPTYENHGSHVEGLSNARARMHDLAAQIPGQYFVCLIGSDEILAGVETFKKREAAKAKTA
jgi:hypothetical protein